MHWMHELYAGTWQLHCIQKLIGTYVSAADRELELECLLHKLKGARQGPIALWQDARSGMPSDLDAAFDRRMICVDASFLPDSNDHNGAFR